MRKVLSGGVILLAVAGATMIAGQTGEKPTPAKAKPKIEAAEKLTGSGTVRATLAQLQLEIKTSPLRDPRKFKEFLEILTEQLAANGRDVTILVDMAAFREEGPDAPDPFEANVQVLTSRERASVFSLLRQAVSQLPVKSAVLVRADRVEIVPLARTSKEYMLNQTFFADFKERRLDLVLEELTDMTGVSIILDARAKQKAQTPVTGRFLDDVALQDAVRMLTDMADLKLVYLVTGIYVTTPEHAKEMQKELRDLYEPSAPAGVGVMGGPGGLGGGPLGAGPRGGIGGPPPGAGAPFDPNMNAPWDPSTSPLAPPLPPQRKKRAEAAA
jgi:hypothetical protein